MKYILENTDNCVGCSACAQRCPKQCISMVPDSEGFLSPVIEAEKCIDCGLCKKVCPVLSAGKQCGGSEKYDTPVTWAAWSLDVGIRLKSSSGGLFSMLAEDVLKKGGSVFGAAFGRDFTVKHLAVSNVSELDSLRRSKYVQSDMGRCYIEAERLLREHRPVLFSGTGCQIAGLKSFLGKDYPELLTVDLVCFGVPSPKIWSMYLDYMKKRFKSDISEISFRDKANGWKNYCMYISFRNGRIYRRTAVKDPFFIGFGKNIFSRKCCYSCRFRHPESRADITLADFWGAEKLNGTVADDNKGISLVLANTPKGKAAVESLAGKCYLKETVFSEAAALNPRLVSSAPMPALRSRFFGDLNSGMDFAGLQRKYMNTFIQSFKLWVKSILGEQALDGLRKLLGR